MTSENEWRTLAMDWMKIATNLLDVDGDNRAWASSEGWDALVERTQAALNHPSAANSPHDCPHCPCGDL